MPEPAELSTPVSLLATLGFAACGLLLLVVNGQSLPGQQGWPCPRPTRRLLSNPDPVGGAPLRASRRAAQRAGPSNETGVRRCPNLLRVQPARQERREDGADSGYADEDEGAEAAGGFLCLVAERCGAIR
eukprot:scaffold18816_cov60-Phaeocystis_antarctica.AAC.2